MKKLVPLSEEDIESIPTSFNVRVTLDDYDWMRYSMNISTDTKKQGHLNISIDYVGATMSEMYVRQEYKNKSYEHIMSFDTEIFAEHITKYLRKHASNWKKKYAFNGMKEAIEFFNDILAHKKDYRYREIPTITDDIPF